MNPPRERILTTATKLFHTQGYSNTGINQIIAEAHVSKASFYNHFLSKDNLCVEFLHKRFTYWGREYEKFVFESTDLKDRIVKSFDFLIYMNDKENFRGCSFLNLLSDVPVERKEIQSIICYYKQKFRIAFSKGINDEILAAHIYLLFEAAIITSQLYRSNELIDKSKLIVQNLLS